MTTSQAIIFFGGVRRLAYELGASTAAIYQWGEYPPAARQYELEVKTKGELKAEKAEPVHNG